MGKTQEREKKTLLAPIAVGAERNPMTEVYGLHNAVVQLRSPVGWSECDAKLFVLLWSVVHKGRRQRMLQRNQE